MEVRVRESVSEEAAAAANQQPLNILLEVCVDNLESATNAVYNGADELEVCSNLAEGGVTPNFDLVKEIKDMAQHYDHHVSFTHKRTKVNVMIRCRPDWDFVYTDSELVRMQQHICIFKTLDIDRFIFGCLTEDKRVDPIACKKLLVMAYPKPATFHRAFDMCSDPIRSVEEIIKLGFSRLLTSGQRNFAADYMAVQLIKFLHDNYGHRIEIMPGCGITPENAKLFVDMECKIIHGSFRDLRKKYEGGRYVTDGIIVQMMNAIIKD